MFGSEGVFEDLEETKDEGVCRTALATPGLLIIIIIKMAVTFEAIM